MFNTCICSLKNVALKHKWDDKLATICSHSLSVYSWYSNKFINEFVLKHEYINMNQQSFWKTFKLKLIHFLYLLKLFDIVTFKCDWYLFRYKCTAHTLWHFIPSTLESIFYLNIKNLFLITQWVKVFCFVQLLQKAGSKKKG